MTTVLNMPSTLSIPCFIPASKASENKQSAGDDNLGLFNDGELDFDLLADYLLDETDANGFSSTTDDQPPASSTNVTPDALDFADPLADSTFQIDFPTAPSNQVSNVAPDPTPTPALVPTTNQIPPAPVVAAPPPQAGMSGPPPLQGIVPAPLENVSQTMIVHQHKRQRVEPPSTSKQQVTCTAMQPITQTYPISNEMSRMSVVNNNMIGQRIGNQKSQAQIDRRRERNRILARRTRLRKKFFFESLQKEVMDLQKENLVLKEIVRSRMDDNKAREILETCKANEELPQVVLEHCGDPTTLGRQDFNLMASIKNSQQSFVITDPSLQDNPIVYASDGFLELTGYSREQVLGRNCRFLQGTDTDLNKVAEIRKALQNGDDVSVTFLNYCADGTPFWNKLFIAALRDAQNNIVNYIGVSVKVAGDHESNNIPILNASYAHKQQDSAYVDSNGNSCMDLDATVQALEGAVAKAVAAAPNIVKNVCSVLP